MPKRPNWIEKAWGKVWHRLNDEISNESLLEVKVNYQSSIHFHTNKWNCFISIDAIIVVEEFKDEKLEPINKFMINPGSSHVVPPQKLHRFYVVKSGKVLEVYWTTNGEKCDVDDITRLDIGGRRY